MPLEKYKLNIQNKIFVNLLFVHLINTSINIYVNFFKNFFSTLTCNKTRTRRSKSPVYINEK